MSGRTLTRLLAAAAAAALAGACGTAAGSPARPAAVLSATPVVGKGSPPARPPARSGVTETPVPTPVTGTDPAAVVRATVTAGNPRLVPSAIPAGMTAAVSAFADRYEVTYTDDEHTRDITLAVNEGVNPPLMTTGGGQTTRQFRGVAAHYAVYDVSAPLSLRYLWWQEPGTWSPVMTQLPGVEYYLSGSGITEAEFFQVAGSLRAVGS